MKSDPEILNAAGCTTVYVDTDFSFDNFFKAEAILREKAKFKIPAQFLSKILAVFETNDNVFLIDRTFIYKESKLVLSYDAPHLSIYPHAKKNASQADNEKVIEISNYLIKELEK